MRIKVTSDSTCDLPKELLERYQITLIPLSVIKSDEAFKDGVTITPQDIFDHVAAGGALCSTSAVSVGEYIDQFGIYSPDYDAVIHINLGSGFSACYQNACLAAQDFENVYVVDSQNLCNGQGLVALKACTLAEDGASVEEILKELEAFVPRVEISFLVDKLDYLVKGGRCSAAAALGANLLNLKPCIEVRNNKMIIAKKYRGSFEKCLTAFAKERLLGRDDLENEIMFLPRTEDCSAVSQTIMAFAQENCHFHQMYYALAGCTISCHCGPGALGLALVKK